MTEGTTALGMKCTSEARYMEWTMLWIAKQYIMNTPCKAIFLGEEQEYKRLERSVRRLYSAPGLNE